MLPLIRGTRTFSAKAIEIEINTCPEGSGTAVTHFLDDCLIKTGKRSVIYISFGTEHWLVSRLLHVHSLLGLIRSVIGRRLWITSRLF